MSRPCWPRSRCGSRRAVSMKAKTFHIAGALAVALMAMGAPVQAEDSTQFQLIIREGPSGMSSVNVAFGHGSEVEFYSNLNEFGVGDPVIDENGFTVKRLGQDDVGRA